MTPNPFSALLHSRKFWLLLFDMVLGMLTYFVTKYAPSAEADLKFVFGAIQPMFLFVVYGIVAEDKALIAADVAKATAALAMPPSPN